MITVHRLGRIFRLAYAGFAAGYSAAIILGASVWLEMRFNVGLLIPACSLAALISAFWVEGRQKWLWLAPQVAAVISFLAVYGMDSGAMSVIPAVLLREGFSLGLLSLDKANLLLAAVIIAGNSLWVKKCYNGGC